MNRIDLSAEKLDFIENSMLALREGLATPELVAELRELLLADREARKFWLFTNQMDSHLQTGFEEDTAVRPTGPPARTRPRPAAVWLGALGAAALLTLGFFIARKNGGETPVPSAAAPMATVISQAGSGILGSRGEPVRTLGLGNYSLSEGLSQIGFENGTRLVLEGPVEFAILGKDSVSLTTGKVWAYCPSAAHGFSILTPSGKKITDLGTEFGVEVRPDGDTEVHVLEGAVRLTDQGKEDLDVSAGKSIRWRTGSSGTEEGGADYGKFREPPDLVQSRLAASREKTRARNDLLMYFDFSEKAGDVVSNRVEGAPSSSNGRILGAGRDSGRSRAHPALRFNGSGDAVAFTIPGYADPGEFTIAMWVKIERMDSALITLLNSDGWETGDLHFQLTRNGALKAGIFGDRDYDTADGVVKPGQWHLLAVTWGHQGREPELFCDGKRLNHRYSPYSGDGSWMKPTPSKPGESQIGSWAKPTLPGQRDLLGRVDEVMVFRGSLGQAEMSELYRIGRP